MNKNGVKCAFVLITTEVGLESNILRSLSSINECKEAYVVYGVYDILAKIEADSTQELRRIINSKIRKLKGVRNTLTILVIE